jgi:sigma-B regulation protein RsbU (phosphoserine phosphatase)
MVESRLRNIPASSTSELAILRPALNEKLIYRVDGSAFPKNFFRVIPPTAYVVFVHNGGASDRAGMKVGDLIFRINGKHFKDFIEADRILRRGQSGKTIAYEVLREGRELTLQVELAKFGIRFALLVMSFSGLLFMATGAFIALNRPQFKAARLLGLAFLMTGFTMAVGMFQRDAEVDTFVVLRNVTILACYIFGLATWLHSSYYFPKERPEILAKPWIPYVPYAIGLAFAAFFITQKNPGPVSAVATLGTLITSLLYTLIVHFIYRKHRSAEIKKLGRMVKWTGITIGAVSVIIFINVDDWMNAGYVGIPLLLLPLAYLYTMGRYRLMEMDLRIRRNIQYTIASALWIVVLAGVSLKILLLLAGLHLNLPNVRFSVTSIEVLEEPLPPAQRELQERGVIMFFAIALGWMAWKAGQHGQRFIDRKFDRGAYDYRRAASELAEVMATKLSMVDLARGIVQKLSDIMHLRRVGVLFFRDQKESCCQEADGFDGAEWKEFCMEVDQRLVSTLDKFRSDSRLSVDYLPPDLQQSFQKHGFRHLIPIRFKGKLVGVLLIGEKLSEAPFHTEDLTFLAAVAKQSSVAIENAFLYEGLAEQERLKHELAIARRIQLASLPQNTPQVEGLDIAGISIPALEVGGDYFDYLNGAPHEITVVVGDVSGKGTSAALYMSKVQGILRSLHGFGLSPRDLFIRANHLLCHDMEKKSFVTTIGADFDTLSRRVVMARAGHLPLFYYGVKKQGVEKITPKGLGFGLDDEGIFATELEEKTMQYEAGDVFLFVTDGITEAHSSRGEEFGEESIVRILENSAGLSAAQIRDHVITAVKRFGAGTQQHDDQTVVVVKVR